MIKSIMSGPGINIQNATVSWPYVASNSSNPIQGMLRINNQDLQVFDGTAWMNVGMSYPTVELNGEAQQLLQWARDQQAREKARFVKMKTNPALRKAYEAVQRAEENFDLLYKFVEHDDSNTQESESVQSSP